MILLAKAALGIGGTLFLAGAYTFREGVIRVEVDEYCAGAWPCISFRNTTFGKPLYRRANSCRPLTPS